MYTLLYKHNYYVQILYYILLRNEDLKVMLDSSKDSQKLDAMKRIVGVSTLLIFPLHLKSNLKIENRFSLSSEIKTKAIQIEKAHFVSKYLRFYNIFFDFFHLTDC